MRCGRFSLQLMRKFSSRYLPTSHGPTHIMAIKARLTQQTEGNRHLRSLSSALSRRFSSATSESRRAFMVTSPSRLRFSACRRRRCFRRTTCKGPRFSDTEAVNNGKRGNATETTTSSLFNKRSEGAGATLREPFSGRS